MSSAEAATDPVRDPWADHTAGLAWRRGLVYLVACLVFGAFAEVFTSLATPVGDLGVVRFWLWTAACVAVILVGYWVIWPLGTLTHGRPLVPSATVFGVLWGLAEGVLFAGVWLLSDRWLPSTVLAVGVTFVVLSAYLGLWHQFYWDLKVSPEHNIEEWNARKVLLVHIPNLAVTLPYLAVTDAVGVFVALQTLGLVGAARAMHFPGFPGWVAVRHGLR